jgi:small subunit ribosomal protein S1
MRKPPFRPARQRVTYTVPQRAAYTVPQHGYRASESQEVFVDALSGAAVADGESFADLFAASLQSPRKAVARRDPEIGDLVQGEIVQIGADFAFLDIGGKSEALIALAELRDENGELLATIGSKLEGHVIANATKEGGLLISGRVQRGAGLSDQIRQAFQQGQPVQGLVTGMNKGGLDIDLGGVRAFLPASQIDLRYCQDPSSYVGRALSLRVTRFDEESRTVIASRRAILEIELRETAEETRKRLRPGQTFAGAIVAIQEPLAIVDLGGLDGTVPTAEVLAAMRAAGKTEETIKLGQRVDVAVLAVEQGRPDPWQSSLQNGLRVSLGLRGLLADPLDEMLSTLSEGERVDGRIVRLEPFGAFVELKIGVEGLIHISAMSERHITHPREVLTLGQVLTATVVNLDRDRRRIGLSLIEEVRAAQAAMAATLTVGQRVKLRIERVEPNGAIVRVHAPGSSESTQPRGLIPNGELNVPRGSDIKKLFPVGRECIAAVQSVDSEGRVRLSLRVAAEQEQAERESQAAAAHAALEAQAAAKAERLRIESSTKSSDSAPAKKRATKARAADATSTDSGTDSAIADKPAKKAPARRTKPASDSPEAVPVVSAISEPPVDKAARQRSTAPLEIGTVEKRKVSRKKVVEPATAEHVTAAMAPSTPPDLPEPEVAKPVKKRARKTA